MCSFYYHQNSREKIGLSPILSANHNVINDTTVNCNGGNNGYRFKNVACKETFNLEFFIYLNNKKMYYRKKVKKDLSSKDLSLV